MGRFRAALQGRSTVTRKTSACAGPHRAAGIPGNRPDDPVRADLADDLVAAVGDVDTSARIHSDSIGRTQRRSLGRTAVTPVACDPVAGDQGENPGRRDPDHTMMVRVAGQYIACRIECDSPQCAQRRIDRGASLGNRDRSAARDRGDDRLRLEVKV